MKSLIYRINLWRFLLVLIIFEFQPNKIIIHIYIYIYIYIYKLTSNFCLKFVFFQNSINTRVYTVYKRWIRFHYWLLLIYWIKAFVISYTRMTMKATAFYWYYLVKRMVLPKSTLSQLLNSVAFQEQDILSWFLAIR